MDEKALDPVNCSFPAGKFIFVGDAHLNHVAPASRKDDYKRSMFNKLEWLIQKVIELEVRVVVFSGDLLHVKQYSDDFNTELNGVFRKFPCPVFSIVGNHEVNFASPEYLHKSTLGVLMSSGVIKRLGSITIGDLTLVGHDFEIEVKPPQAPTPNSWLVAHAFYGAKPYSSELTEVVTAQMIKVFGYKGACLGHDHVSYPIDLTEGVIIVRPGALSRVSVAQQDRSRDVKVAVIDATYPGTPVVDIIEVPVESAEMVFSVEQTQRKGISSYLKDFVATYLSEAQTGSTDLFGQLKELCKENAEVYQDAEAYILRTKKK